MRYFFLLLSGICSPIFLLSQSPAPLLNIYLDPAGFAGDDGFLKQELQFVNHVSDRRLSDVQVQSVYEPVGNGSARYRYLFFGYGRFEGQNDTVTWHLNAAELKGIFREKSLRALKRGLLPYLMQTSWADSLEYHFSPLVNNQQVRDGWNLWTFNINSQAWISGSRTRRNQPSAYSDHLRELVLRENLNIWQITPDYRLGAELSYQGLNSNRQISYTTGFNLDTVIRQNGRLQSIYANIYGVRSIGSHWAVGTQMNVSKSVQKGEKSVLNSSVILGLEYNLFPYEQFFRRRLLANISIGLSDVPDEFDAWHKLLSASLTYVQVARWGYVEANVSEQVAGIYDNRIWTFQCAARAGLNVAKNLFIIAEPVIQQRISLMNVDPEVWRNTQFQYQFFLGLSYYFGSGYRNVVNPRLSSIF